MKVCTPGSNSQKTSRSLSADQTPTTPKLPFDPPRRRSSLAFSRIMDSPACKENQDEETALAVASEMEYRTPSLRSNIGKKRTVETPSRYSGVSPGHVAQIQRVFQTARANLHLDMHFAASPAGSIDSRLPQTDQDQTKGLGVEPRPSEVSWRYSTVPKLFSATTLDVREPLPDASPTLPAIAPRRADNSVAIEPTSSGFASPVTAKGSNIEDDDFCLPPLPNSSPSSGNFDENTCVLASYKGIGDISELTQPMTGLRVGSGSELYDAQMTGTVDDKSPIIDHLKRRPGGLELTMDNLQPPDSVFLSQSAKAAAESARVKRGLLRNPIDQIGTERDRYDHIHPCPDPAAHQVLRSSCPDPTLHHHLVMTPCPDPFAHNRINSIEGPPNHAEASRAHPRAWGNEYFAPGGIGQRSVGTMQAGRRTTAAGSPMPFAKRTLSPSTGQQFAPTPQLYFASSPVPQLHRQLLAHGPPSTAQHSQRPGEHYRPGGYYASGLPNSRVSPAANLYSFSTAAAKVTGESTAPDSRIRDSYRTDTLTPLARPPERFRKNGIATTLPSSGAGRPSRRGLPVGPRSRRIPSERGRFEPPKFHERQFRSRIPRPSIRCATTNYTRKRTLQNAGMPDFDIAEDDSAVSIGPSMRLRPSEEIMEVDDHTRAAVRLSLFGPNTPEHLQGEREGIKELSPNVLIWRKNMSVGSHYRKKRRPSYWDGDLEEVRSSPAGRGGIASSPTVSKRSMFAELENTSSLSDRVPSDEDEVASQMEGNEVGRNHKVEEVDMTNATK